MPKLLEVIVTSLEEALEAQAGGADRLELVRAFDQGGLTPPFEVADAIVARVQVPVRVMLRENAGMSVRDEAELEALVTEARAFSKLGLDGLVAGFATDGQIDAKSLSHIAGAAPGVPITFHRAFETLHHPEAQIRKLKEFGAVDRILIRTGRQFPLPYLSELQAAAQPGIRLITGPGLDSASFANLAHYAELREVHVGRAAREPATVAGKVSPSKISAMKKALL